MTYIKLDDIINEVKRFYNSYFESGLDIDNSIIVPDVRLLLRKFGLKTKNKNSRVLKIENYKSELPINFYKLIFAVGCFEKTEFIPPDENQPVHIQEFTSHYKINNCEVTPCTDECGNYINIIQTIDNGKVKKYNDFFPLLISREVKEYGCYDNNCFNFKVKNSNNEIRIKDGFLETNFCDGNVYIEYYETIYDEDENIIVPEDEILQKAIKEQVKLSILEFLLMNTTDQSIPQKYQLQSTLTSAAIYHAINLIKTNEVSDIKKISNYYNSRYKMFENMIYGIKTK